MIPNQLKVELSQDIVVDAEVTPKTIDIAFEQWLSYQPRYQKLLDYYIGKQDFSPVHGEEQNHIVANHCRYITDVLVGYQFGNQPRYTTEEGDVAGKGILDLFEEQDKWSVEINIGEDLSIFGRTNELVYMPKDKDVPNSVEIDPMHGFVAYAGDVERDSVFGAVVFSYMDDSKRTIYRLYIYDTAMMSVWESDSKERAPRNWKQIEPPVNHGFGRVPLIEYKNNRKAMGDFEQIMDLQDAYNSLLSDRQDNQDSFAQAMLVLSGAVIGVTQDEIEDSKTLLKQHKVLQLDEDAVAQYLVKTTDESGVQIVQDQYSSDIHKFAQVPDLSDEQFAGNASGVAMAYKLFGTDQVVSKKQAMMQKGFTRRCKLYDFRLNNPSLNPNYDPVSSIDAMTITFNLNAPQDLSYIATALAQLTGGGKVMSLQTARTLVSVIPDPEEETELVNKEAEESMEMTRQTFDYDAVEQGADEEDTKAEE